MSVPNVLPSRLASASRRDFHRGPITVFVERTRRTPRQARSPHAQAARRYGSSRLSGVGAPSESVRWWETVRGALHGYPRGPRR